MVSVFGAIDPRHGMRPARIARDHQDEQAGEQASSADARARGRRHRGRHRGWWPANLPNCDPRSRAAIDTSGTRRSGSVEAAPVLTLGRKSRCGRPEKTEGRSPLSARQEAREKREAELRQGPLAGQAGGQRRSLGDSRLPRRYGSGMFKIGAALRAAGSSVPGPAGCEVYDGHANGL